MKKLFQIVFLILFLTSYGFYLNSYSFVVARGQFELDKVEKYYDYKGITHVHSILSTGSGTASEIIRAAQEQKHNFLFVTDTNRLEHDQKLEGYFNQLLVTEGGEYSYLDSRILYYNGPVNQPPTGTGLAQVYFADLLSQKVKPRDAGFLVIAHPFLSRYNWSGDYPDGLDGIEVINLKRVLEVAWKEKRIDSLWSILTYPLNASLSLLRIYKDPVQELQLWDSLSKSRHTIGLMGTDATAKAIITPNFYLKFPSYSTAFSVASNHVLLKSELTGDFKSDKQKIVSALQDGQFYMSLDILGSPEGFWAEYRTKGKAYLIGVETKYVDDSQLVIHLPSKPKVPYEVRILKDGETLHTSNSTDTTVNLSSPGVYRIVVRILVPMPFPEGNKWVPWIYTNPFYLR